MELHSSLSDQIHYLGKLTWVLFCVVSCSKSNQRVKFFHYQLLLFVYSQRKLGSTSHKIPCGPLMTELPSGVAMFSLLFVPVGTFQRCGLRSITEYPSTCQPAQNADGPPRFWNAAAFPIPAFGSVNPLRNVRSSRTEYSGIEVNNF